MMLIVFFNDTATTEIYTHSLHDALPISPPAPAPLRRGAPPPVDAGEDLRARRGGAVGDVPVPPRAPRSEEHTSELQSRQYLVCRLLLEKKNIQSRARSTHRCSLPGQVTD